MTNKSMRSSEKGFSLVELAIALTVIGILLAGILKGREMVDNARASRVISDVKNYEAAAVAFKDVYGALPGDMPGNARITGCSTGPCSAIAGNGDGVIGRMYGVSVPATTGFDYDRADLTQTGENRGFWLHLAKAGLISTIDKTYANNPAQVGTPKLDYPETPWSGVAYDVYSWHDANPHQIVSGHYIKTKTLPLGDAGQPSLHASIIAQIDRKVDDGRPLTGRVVGWNNATGTGEGVCYNAVSANSYSQSEVARCEGAIRVDF